MRYPTCGREPERQYGSRNSPASIRSSSWRQFPKLWFLFAEVGGSLRSVLAKHLRYLTRSGSLSSMTLLDSIVESLAQPVDFETISGWAASFGRPYWRFERWMAGGVDGVVEPVTITIVDSEKAGLDRITSRGDKQQRLRTTATEGVEIKLRFDSLGLSLAAAGFEPRLAAARHARRVTCPFVCQILA